MIDDLLRYSADDLDGLFIGPQSGGEVVQVRDVAILEPEAGENGVDFAEKLIHLPRFSHESNLWINPPDIELADDLRIVHLEKKEADRIIAACTPRGHYFWPVRQGGQGYSLQLQIEKKEWEENRFTWDPALRLRDALAMSRLVLDNGYSTEFAARIFDYSDGAQEIMWAPGLTGKRAYRVTQQRDWLTYEEADELQVLLECLWESREHIPPRIRRAMWNAEYAAGLQWLDLIVPLIVVALEALTNTSKLAVTKQFVERVPQMAAAAGSVLVDEDLCRRIYDARSRWSHGEHIRLRPSRSDFSDSPQTEPAAEQQMILDDVARLQAALRAIIRKSLEDSDFRNLFESKTSIRSAWPVRDDSADENSTAL